MPTPEEEDSRRGAIVGMMPGQRVQAAMESAGGEAAGGEWRAVSTATIRQGPGQPTTLGVRVVTKRKRHPNLLSGRDGLQLIPAK